MKGIFSIYKPKGPTSNDVLREIRRISGTRKVGHAGTLDPLARGILVVGVGKAATKKLGVMVQKEKEYLAKVRLGAASTTDDAEGGKTRMKVPRPPSIGDIRRVTRLFRGRILQRPPVYSAVKIRGVEAYKRARRGEKVSLEPRRVEIRKVAIQKYKWPYLSLRVVTGPGVYIRSLARDIGEKLGTGGYLASLERTRVGGFTKKKALTLAQVRRLWKAE